MYHIIIIIISLYRLHKKEVDQKIILWQHNASITTTPIYLVINMCVALCEGIFYYHLVLVYIICFRRGFIAKRDYLWVLRCQNRRNLLMTVFYWGGKITTKIYRQQVNRCEIIVCRYEFNYFVSMENVCVVISCVNQQIWLMNSSQN